MIAATRSKGAVRFAENMRRRMDLAGVDVEGFARRAGIPAKRVERILAANTALTLPELARISVALGAEPAAMYRDLYA